MELNMIDEIRWATEGVSQNHPRHCHDVWAHINKVVERLIDGGAPGWLVDAAWLHDVGKPFVKAVNPRTGFDTFYKHQRRSVEWAREKGIPIDSVTEWYILRHEDPLENLERLDRDHKYHWLWLRTADLAGQNPVNEGVLNDMAKVLELRRGLVLDIFKEE